MLSFHANMKITKDCKENKVINGFNYNVYIVEAGNLEIRALFSERYKIQVGDCITSKEVFLTNYDEARTPVQLALRIGSFTEVLEEQFEPMEYLKVRVNGKIYKSKNLPIRKVGVLQKPFLSCFVSIKNERNIPFNVLMVSFNKLAEKLDEVPSYSYINLTARLKNKMNQEGYELNLSDFELVNK